MEVSACGICVFKRTICKNKPKHTVKKIRTARFQILFSIIQKCKQTRQVQINNSECCILYILGCIASVFCTMRVQKWGKSNSGRTIGRQEQKGQNDPSLKWRQCNCKHVRVLALPLESELCLEVLPSASSLGGSSPAIPLSLESKLVFL